MTYSELLHKVSFDEIVPYIEKYRSNRNIALFKSHYDLLRQIEPKKKDNSNRKIEIACCPSENLGKEHTHYLTTKFLSGKNWEEDLAKELVFKIGVRQIWGDIAACCLSKSLEYDYFPETIIEYLKERKIWVEDGIFGKYRYKAEQIQKRIGEYGGGFPLISEILKLPAFIKEVKYLLRHNDYCFSIDLNKFHSDYEYIEWFYEGRYYFRMWTIGKFICDALPSCQIDNSFSPKELFTLFLVNNYDVYRYLSFADNMEDRGKWLWELVTKYNAFWHKIYSNAVLCLGMSHEHPATESDMKHFNEIMSWLSNQNKDINIKWGVYYDESLDNQLRLSAILYE